MSTLRDMVRAIRVALEKAGIEGAAREAPLIASAATCIPRDRIGISMDRPVGPDEWQILADILPDRLARKPLSHLLGYRDFFRHRFEVTGDVLDPRPETETLVRRALAGRFSRVLDLGTGSGCILLSLLAGRPGARGVGTDISRSALKVAGRNAAALGLADRVALIESDWFSGVSGRFDLIVSNPPYIALAEMAGLAPELAHEPRHALTDEGDGLGGYRAIAAGAAAHLLPGGALMVEIGATQARSVAAILTGRGFRVTEVVADLDGRDRVICAAMPDFP